MACKFLSCPWHWTSLALLALILLYLSAPFLDAYTRNDKKLPPQDLLQYVRSVFRWKMELANQQTQIASSRFNFSLAEATQNDGMMDSGFNFTLAEATQNDGMMDSGCHKAMLLDVAWSIAPRMDEVIGLLWKYPSDCTSFSNFSAQFFQQCPQQELGSPPVSRIEAANLSCLLCSTLIAELPGEHWQGEDLWWISVPLPELESNGTEPHPHPFGTLTIKRQLEPSVEMRLENTPVSCRIGGLAAVWTVYTKSPIESLLHLVSPGQNSTVEVLEITGASNASDAHTENGSSAQPPYNPFRVAIIDWGKGAYSAASLAVSATCRWVFFLGTWAVDALVTCAKFVAFAFLSVWALSLLLYPIMALATDYTESRIVSLKQELRQKETEKAATESALKDKERALKDKQSDVVSLQSHVQYLKDQHALVVKTLASHCRVDDDEVWQFQGDSGEWVSFPDKASKELTKKYREGQQACQVSIDGKTYDIDFNKFLQTNQRRRKERKIQCFFNLPPHWNISDEEALTKFKPGNMNFEQATEKVTNTEMLSKLGEVLNKSLLRQDGTSCKCLHGDSKFVVTEAYQIKNLLLWRRYQRFVRSICDTHRDHGICLDECPEISNALMEFAGDLIVNLAGNERLLFHGTPDFEVAKTISMEGFDNRTARSTGLYGKGTYFAAQTCKSAQYATKDGMKSKASPVRPGTMLLARVAIGDPFFTPDKCRDLSRPPKKNGIPADSIIAKVGIPNGQSGAGVQSHMEVVTFAPEQAYPEFIIRFVEQ